jgi:hypothetical protein
MPDRRLATARVEDVLKLQVLGAHGNGYAGIAIQDSARGY